jgi:hypothetical protein
MRGHVEIDVVSVIAVKQVVGTFYFQGKVIQDAVNSIIRNYAMMAGAAGCITNIGGLITLPVAIPANIAGVFAIQMRMMQEICFVRGVDPKGPLIKTIGIIALMGSTAFEEIEKILARVGNGIALQLVRQLPGSILIAINQAVGFRLVTKFGTTGAVNLGRWIPLVGGVLYAGVDGAGTFAVGKAFNELLFRATEAGGLSGGGDNPTGTNVPSCAGSELYAKAMTDLRPQQKAPSGCPDGAQ